MSGPRHTARGLVIHDGKLLLMERWREGKHYFSIPGGGIEPGETAKETVVREIMEETGCEVSVDRLLYIMQEGNRVHSIYLCKYISGEPHLPNDAPEALHHSESNRFKPCWQPLPDIASLPFLIWKPVQERFVHDMSHGFSGLPVEIVAEPLS